MQALQPLVKVGPVEDGVVHHRAVLGFFGHGAGGMVGKQVTALAGHGDGGGCSRWSRCSFDGCGQALEAVLFVKRQQALVVGRVQRDVVKRGQARDVVGQRAVGLHGDELAAQGQLAAGNRLAQVVASHALDGVGVGDQVVERAIFFQPLGGGLGAHLDHAGHVVHGVAHQGLVVHHQRGGHAKFCRHARHVAALAAHGVDDGDVLVDQLAQVFVAAGNDDFNALRCGRVGQGGDDVVGLHAGHGHHLPAQQVHHFVDGLDLAAQIVGHGRARGLVFGVQGIAEGGARGVEHAHGVVGHHLFAQGLHHVDHAANGTGGRACGVARYGPQVGHGVEGAVEVAGAVHQHQGLFVSHARIVHTNRQPPQALASGAGPESRQNNVPHGAGTSPPAAAAVQRTKVNHEKNAGIAAQRCVHPGGG